MPNAVGGLQSDAAETLTKLFEGLQSDAAETLTKLFEGLRNGIQSFAEDTFQKLSEKFLELDLRTQIYVSLVSTAATAVSWRYKYALLSGVYKMISGMFFIAGVLKKVYLKISGKQARLTREFVKISARV